MFLYRLIEALDKKKVPYALVGGFAVALHGAVRGTVDIDLVIRLAKKDFESAEGVLKSLGLESRLPVSAAEVFKFREEYIKNRNLIAWNFYNPLKPIETVDLIITKNLDDLKIVRIRSGELTLKVVSVPDLIQSYRIHHMAHHRYAGNTEDPDFELAEGFPIPLASLLRKLARDTFGITALKRVYGLLLMDFGYIQYTASNRSTRLDQGDITFSKRLVIAVRNLHGVIIANGVLFAILSFAGHSEHYLLWVLSYATTFSIFVRIRSMAEHAATQMDLDPIKCTRTTLANPLARVTVAPHFVNYHLEHHLMMTVPHFRFKEFHRLLKERGALQGAYVSTGSWDVLRQMVRGVH